MNLRTLFLPLLLSALLLPLLEARERRDPRKPAKAGKPAPEIREITPEARLSPENYPVGETLDYIIRWTAIPAGTGRIRIAQAPEPVNGHPALRIVVTAKSGPFISAFYSVDDNVESWIHASEFKTLRYVKRLREGKYRRDEQTDFDYGAMTAAYRKEVKGKNPVARTNPVKEWALDPLAALFYLRNYSLEPGTRFKMRVHTDGKEWKAHVTVIEEKILRVRFLGAFRAVLVDIAGSFEGIFIHTDKSLKVWLEKETKIPLFAHVKLPFGSINLDLEKAEPFRLRPVETFRFGREAREERPKGAIAEPAEDEEKDSKQ